MCHNVYLVVWACMLSMASMNVCQLLHGSRRQFGSAAKQVGPIVPIVAMTTDLARAWEQEDSLRIAGRKQQLATWKNIFYHVYAMAISHKKIDIKRALRFHLKSPHPKPKIPSCFSQGECEQSGHPGFLGSEWVGAGHCNQACGVQDFSPSTIPPCWKLLPVHQSAVG